MSNEMNALPLTRRLMAGYLMCGLACLFACLASCLNLAWRGELINLVPLTAILPLLILILGTVILRRTVWLNSQIEQQLSRIASIPESAELSLQPISAPGPAAVGWNTILDRVTSSGSLQDIESRLSQALTGLKEKRFELILNSLSDGIAVTNASGEMVLANNALAALLSQDGDQFSPGSKMEELLLLREAKDTEYVSSKLEERSHSTVFDLNRGQEITDGVLRIARYPLLNPNGHANEHVWTVQDITQRRIAEEHRNQFVFTATHELRTPLANIKAYAETLVLHENIDLEQQKQFCNTINAEATRVSRFVDELLTVSQMESGAMSLERHETDIERLISEATEHTRPQMTEKGVEFETAIPAKLPKLRIDKDKIAASLINLLGNASKYTPPEGKVRLEIEVEEAQMSFHVEDNGIGISDEDQPKVFGKFYRSSDERVREINGSGLGLAFVQEVARLHGGKLILHSELDKGSKFTLTLPI